MQISLVPIQRKIEFNVGPCGTYESELDFTPIKTIQPCSQFISQGMRLLNVFKFILDAFIRFFGFFCFGFLHHCQCKTTPLQEDIITFTSGVTSHCIVLHAVSD